MGRPPSWIAMLAGMGGWLIPRYYFGVPFDTMLAALAAAALATLIGYPSAFSLGTFFPGTQTLIQRPTGLLQARTSWHGLSLWLG